MLDYQFDFYAHLGSEEALITIKGSELVRLWKEGIITYNPEIQRGSRNIINKNGESVQQDIYNKSNVSQIYKSMVKGTYFTDMITLNVLDNDDCIFDNGSAEQTMKLYVSGEISVSDGQHRIRALEMLSKTNEEGTTNSGRNGISISNSKDSRTYFIQEIKNKFEALLEN